MTRSQIRDLIVETTGRTDKTDLADLTIDLCFARLGQLHEWQQTRTDASQAIVQGTASFVLPANTRRIIEVRFILGLQSYPMELLPKAVAVRYAPWPAALPQNRPVFCYRETDGSGNDTLYIIPASNGAYAIEMTVGMNPAIGSGDGDVANIPDLDETVAAFGAAYVFRSVEMFQEAAAWDAQFATLVEVAIRADKRRPAEMIVREQHPGRRGSMHRSGDPQHDPFIQRWT